MAISWDEPEDSNGIILDYIVFYRETDDVNASMFNQLSDLNLTMIVVGQLRKYTSYTFQVAARTAAGYGQLSEPVQNRTDEDSKVIKNTVIPCQGNVLENTFLV